MTIASSALNGIHLAESRLEQAATRLASSSAESPDVVSLSDEMVALIQAGIAVAANVTAFRAETDIQKSLINLLGYSVFSEMSVIGDVRYFGDVRCLLRCL